MTDFIESPRFPDDVSVGTSFGPEYFTWIATQTNGYAPRDERWQDSLHRFNVVKQIESDESARLLLTLFHICKGRGKGFRIKDFLDFEVDEDSGRLGEASVAPGGVTAFQLTKKYTWDDGSDPDLTYYRPIQKPYVVTGVYKNGVLVNPADYTVDMTTGILTFDVAPALNDTLYWVGEFDVPASFDVDRLQVLSYDAGIWDFGQVPIVEIRLESA